jgi:diacylglycerol kinase (ATP)
MSPFKGQTGLKRILNAAGYSLAGLRAAFVGEAAFRQLLLINLVLVPVAFFLDVSRVERALMVAVCVLMFIFAWTGFRIGRREGGLLLAGYGVYLAALWPS